MVLEEGSGSTKESSWREGSVAMHQRHAAAVTIGGDQERLQVLAEEELPESQCCFRKGRSCTDMIFTVRQLMEKSWEHRAKLFVTFLDAYDSVPRSALWVALRKLGVPDQTIQLVKSFHQDMQAKICLEGKLLEEIDVDNGLRQGHLCCSTCTPA